MEYFSVDASKYKGVFGSAVLSKYPIKYVELRPLETKPYDWYWGEQKKVGIAEGVRRIGAKGVFKNIIERELKVGNRHYFRVDLDVPDLPEKTLTVINIHLEAKSQPKDRKKQMEEILSYVQDIKHPVILMGDFNTVIQDISPTTVYRVTKRTVTDPTVVVSAAVTVLFPYAILVNTSRFISNFTKNFNNPTAINIPIIAPNKIRSFFKMMKKYRFSDGGAFDFRGDKKRSINGKKRMLSNSNQRGTKGFVTTFRVRRPLGIIGKYKLDWVFVKSYLKDPKDKSGPYRFAPHFGETLEDMNFELELPLSDHSPIVVDLPFNEPQIGDVRQ